MKAGILSIGLDTYWAQFDGLLDNLNGYHAEIRDRIAGNRSRSLWLNRYAAFTSMCLIFACASLVLGSSILRTPFLKEASIFDSSTSPGSSRVRRNEPKRRSRR